MNHACLLVRPEHDTTTHYLSNWSEETALLARNKGIKVLDLRRDRANQSEFESMIREFSPRFVILNGHGSDTMVTGHCNLPIVVLGENEKLLNSRIVYALSCRSAKILGPKSVEAGAASYTGYDDDFVFLYEPDKVSRPLQDETAKLFLEPSALFTTSLIKGNSVGDAYNKSKGLFKETMMRLMNSDAPDTNLVRFLWWDLTHFVSHGDSDARI